MGTIGGDELAQLEKHQDDGGGGAGGAGEERILVSVRLRPLSDREVANGDPCDWECINETTILYRNTLNERSTFPSAYVFDKVFPSDCPTRRVYEEAAKEVALSVVSGINSSIFAYGQTSSGKTYTMSGVTEHAVSDIYDYIKKHQEREFVLKFSAMEIYNEAVRDLLSADSTPLRLLDDPEKGTVIERLTEEILRDKDHLKRLLSICEAQRQIGETSLNETSSRSHQILRLTIESAAREFVGKDKSSTLVASVNFVDLAGSERASQAMSAGMRLKEGCHINRSLLTLGTVIRKLSKGRNGHIPYRDSKLTRILQPSLGGNARTAIICTMCPARSHIEQSRNTLLFASCAKEVVTTARVNVVMSDKALVKHLQKELARLENELRYPAASNTSFFEALLKEKDNQIRKMEKEIRGLMQQRDLAQSRLEDLLLTVKDSQSLRQLDADSESESSFAANQTNMSITATTNKYTGSECPMSYSHNSKKQDSFPYQQSMRRPNIAGLLQSQIGKDFTLDDTEEFEDSCKEVRCIEMDEISMTRRGMQPSGSDNSPPFSDDNANLEDENDISNLEIVAREDLSALVPDTTVGTLEQQFHDDKRISNISVKQDFDGSSPWYAARELQSSRSSLLSRSKSCRATLMHSPLSTWFLDDDRNDNTPPSMSLKAFPGRPEGFHARGLPVMYKSEYDELSASGSQSFESQKHTAIHGKKDSQGTAEEEHLTTISDFVAGMKLMAQVHYEKHDQELEDSRNEDVAVEKSMKDAGVDPMLNYIESPSRCPFEFGKLQQEIINLWHVCHISLVHRTYFFLLFKGDPTDSIYMEVEFRRLSFLKRTCFQDLSKPLVGEGFITKPASRLKDLRHERAMLCRRMQRRLSVEERESLYRKWGIPLNSKQRRMQLAHLLWSNSTDMEHIRESASLIAKLVGLLDSTLALKEMFGLSFELRRNNHRSYRWIASHVNIDFT